MYRICDTVLDVGHRVRRLLLTPHVCPQARVCREKADVKSEVLAKEISDRLPFLEYELHRQLLTKLRILGMNALFDLTVRL